MHIRGKHFPLITISGLLVIMFYCSFTLASWALYPHPFTPWSNYLSRLGNFDYSPLGAWFYNIGCILTGIALFPFFIGLIDWHLRKWNSIAILGIGQILGILSACALILIGVYSEDQGAPHMTASSTFFLINFAVLIFVSIGLLFHPKFIKAIAAYGLLIDFSSLSLQITVGGPLVEWFTVFGALVFVGLVSYNSMKLGNEVEKEGFSE
ncbi:MAG: hypothetical protein ACFE7R_11950 [Candidatus Hodarchaeota archaeon]